MFEFVESIDSSAGLTRSWRPLLIMAFSQSFTNGDCLGWLSSVVFRMLSRRSCFCRMLLSLHWLAILNRPSLGACLRGTIMKNTNVLGATVLLAVIFCPSHLDFHWFCRMILEKFRTRIAAYCQKFTSFSFLNRRNRLLYVHASSCQYLIDQFSPYKRPINPHHQPSCKQ